ncbi:MAG: FAD-dependent oxidoreductase, partial [Chloroflexota bacterium]|nr:FAD-dependent oxidoreductase [Chloroflexota bacterium]
ELDELPEHLLIVGGGYIGLEFGQLFHRLGSDVTILQHGPQLVAREDADVAQALTEILREDGVEVLLEADTRKAEQTDEGQIALTVQMPEGEREVRGSHLLVAAVRKPNTDHLNLEAAGVEMDQRGYIRVTERLETNVPGIYALGDVNGGPAFTHISYDDYRIIAANLLEGVSRTSSSSLIPYTLFTDPQLGRIGLSEKEAREQGYNIRVAKIPMSWVARAIEVGETRGLMKAVVDVDTDQILGAAVLGIEGGELMAMLQIAMMGNLPYTSLRDGVFAHPTLAESLNTLFMYMD